MFRYFRRRKEGHLIPRGENKAVTHMQRWVTIAQTWFAETLTKQDRKLTVIQRKFAFLLFCLIMGGISTCWIIQGIFYPPTAKPSFLQHQSITAPKKVQLPDSLDIKFLREYHRWQSLRKLDSTKK
jgi:hypothetical protein